MKIRETGAQLNTSLTAAHEIVRDTLGYRRVYAWWVAKPSSKYHNQMHMGLCCKHIMWYKSINGALVKVKINSMIWKYTQTPLQEEMVTVNSINKITAIDF